MFFFLKIIISAFIIALASELANWNRVLSAIIISLPLISLLTFIWIYIDTQDTQKIAALSYDVFWLVLSSLIFFLLFPALIKYGFNFWISFFLSCIGLMITYYLVIYFRSSFF